MSNPTAVTHFVLTLDGTAQPLLVPGVDATEQPRVRTLSLQPGEGGAAPIYLGGPGVTVSNYGVRLPAADAGVPPPPYLLEFVGTPPRLQDFYVIGTPGQELQVLVVPYL